MSNPATSSDAAARWLFDAPVPDAAVLQLWLDAAWRLLVSKDRTLEDRLTAGAVDPAAVVDVVCAVALRVLGNPQGKRQEAIDDYSWTRDSSVSAGSLYVSMDELAMLRDPALSRSARSVRLIAYGES